MRKTCIFSWFGYPIDISERFRLIKQAGFDGVLLWWGDENIDTDGAKEKQPELALENGLIIENVHLPFSGTNDLWLDNINGDEYENLIITSIEQCANFQIPTVVMHLTRGNNPPPICKTGLNRIRRIVDIAENLNVSVALENLRKPEYMDYILQEISSTKLGFCYDSGHNNCFTPKRDFLKHYGDRLFALHLHDNDGIDDLHMIPFDGNIQWNKIKNELDDICYKGAISLEVEQGRYDKYRNMSAEEFLRRAFISATKL
ncbi:MAG: sugar phosphate isomerase/epimerase family protein [Clostridium sp.]|uniref:sugar phosphate isomerase/epimerase family protein n=1 Tax=Clostridium sp. TaxID=1506 RepID=UPI003D6D5E62